MVKEEKWRGKTLQELKEIDLEEFMKLVPSKTRRTLKKGFTDKQKKLLNNIEKGEKDLKTHCRDMVIVPQMLDLLIKVHNGKQFVPVKVQMDMLGHCLGEFALTRQEIKHSAPGVGATRSSAFISVK